MSVCSLTIIETVRETKTYARTYSHKHTHARKQACKQASKQAYKLKHKHKQTNGPNDQVAPDFESALVIGLQGQILVLMEPIFDRMYYSRLERRRCD